MSDIYWYRKLIENLLSYCIPLRCHLFYVVCLRLRHDKWVCLCFVFSWNFRPNNNCNFCFFPTDNSYVCHPCTCCFFGLISLEACAVYLTKTLYRVCSFFCKFRAHLVKGLFPLYTYLFVLERCKYYLPKGFLIFLLGLLNEMTFIYVYVPL